ncbi:MAG: hypothetical protein HQL23_00230 [Candidatus Omnitrophica bacterium]|nr:hypothetical protein [Candidatus Omnitrophota bacterium]
MSISKFKKTLFYRIFTVWLIFFCGWAFGPGQSVFAGPLLLPAPGAMVGLTPMYTPVMMKGLVVHPDNPLLFDFIIDSGHSGYKTNSPEFKAEAQKLIKYFLASLTIKDEDLWVNFSPYEKNRIVPDALGKTEMGRDMLAQDYVLKQLTASLMYPEKELGKKFWDTVYAKVRKQYGNVDIPVDTFNKVWIVADHAKVLERNNTAFVIGWKLKVMMEEDYVAIQKKTTAELTGFGTPPLFRSAQSMAASAVKEVVIPEIEKEVNQGKNFTQLRQMFHAMILASWYKKTLKNALINEVYSNTGKIEGVKTADPAEKDKIYERYLHAFSKGVFNYIKEDTDPVTEETTSRKYFSGGLHMLPDPVTAYSSSPAETALLLVSDAVFVTERMQPIGYTKLTKAAQSSPAKLTQRDASIMSDILRNLSYPGTKTAGDYQKILRGWYAAEVKVGIQEDPGKDMFLLAGTGDELHLNTDPKPEDWEKALQIRQSVIVTVVLPNQNVVVVRPPVLALEKDIKSLLPKLQNEIKFTYGASNRYWGQQTTAPALQFFLRERQAVDGVVVDGIQLRDGSIRSVVRKDGIDPSPSEQGIADMAKEKHTLFFTFQTTVASDPGLQQHDVILALPRGKVLELVNKAVVDAYREMQIRIWEKTIWELSIIHYAGIFQALGGVLSGDSAPDSILNQVREYPKLPEGYRVEYQSAPQMGDKDSSVNPGVYASIDIVAPNGNRRPISSLSDYLLQAPFGSEWRFNIFKFPNMLPEELIALRLAFEGLAVNSEAIHEVSAAGAQQSSPAEMTPLGGVAFNGKRMGMEIAKEGSGIEFKFDPAVGAELRAGHFRGLEAIFLGITPLPSVLPLLGLNNREMPADVKKF